MAGFLYFYTLLTTIISYYERLENHCTTRCL